MLTACTSRRKATTAIDEFLSQNLVNTEYTTEFLAMDSTHKLKNHIIVNLQQQASADKAFKKGIKWDKPSSEKYIFMRMRVIQGTDTMIRTFYLNPEMTKVLAFKEN